MGRRIDGWSWIDKVTVIKCFNQFINQPSYETQSAFPIRLIFCQQISQNSSGGKLKRFYSYRSKLQVQLSTLI